MARQKELPGTRRDDEPKPPPSIGELDDVCAAIRKAKARRVRANQDVVAQTKIGQELLVKHGLTWYPYEDGDIKRKLVLESKVKDVKAKVEKRGDDGSDEEDEG